MQQLLLLCGLPGAIHLVRYAPLLTIWEVRLWLVPDDSVASTKHNCSSTAQHSRCRSVKGLQLAAAGICTFAMASLFQQGSLAGRLTGTEKDAAYIMTA
jgi:hypothetical protein